MQRRQFLGVAGTVAGLLATGSLAACSDSPNAKNAAGGARDYLTIGMPNGTQTENNNPFIATSSANLLGYRWMIYENLTMWNPVKPAEPGKPWLASSVTWAPDYKSVDIAVRSGATWSDGQPLTAEDVAFTFELLKKHEALNISAIDFGDIQVSGSNVKLTFPSSQFIYQNKILAFTPIVPKHIWEKIADPTTDTNKQPVGSGPYVLKSFTQQSMTLSLRESGYWQDLPKVKELRYTSYSNNDTQTTALVNGECEWSFVFIPNYKTVFLAKNPENYHVWAPGVLAIHGLFINTTKKPFDDPKLRQAMNMVINRTDIFNQAEAGYFHPEIKSVTGLPSPAGDAYIAPEYQGKLLKVDVEGAKALLTSAGYKLQGTTLLDPSGTPVTLKLSDPGPWSDYQTTLEIIKSNLAEIGIAATVEKPNQDVWDGDITKGDFEASVRWTNGGSTPWDLYQTIMDGALLKPVGTTSQGNFGRFDSPEATQALQAYANAADDNARAAALNTLQKVFVEQVPMLPIGADNVGAAYNDKYWTGWPTDDNAYAGLQPSQPYSLDVVLHLTPAS